MKLFYKTRIRLASSENLFDGVILNINILLLPSKFSLPLSSLMYNTEKLQTNSDTQDIITRHKRSTRVVVNS